MAKAPALLIPLALLIISACASPTSPQSSQSSTAAPRPTATNPYASLDQTDLDRRLLTAAADDDVDAARDLVKAGASPNTLDNRHDTAWLITGVTGSVAMAKVLLTADPDLTIRNRFGGLSIIPASERGHADYVEYVATNTDIDIDHVNDLGWTALLEAVILGEGTDRWQRIVRTLVEAGADTLIRDHKGSTALDHARARGLTDIVKILEEG